MRNKLFNQDLKVLSTSMKEKIDRDKYKGTWEKVPIWDLMEMLKDEVKELDHAIYYEPRENIIKECADVANFAMMIAGNVKRGMQDE